MKLIDYLLLGIVFLLLVMSIQTLRKNKCLNCQKCEFEKTKCFLRQKGY